MTNRQSLPAEVVLNGVKTIEETEYTVIWLHGLGADGHDFVPIIPELNLPETARIKFIFPHAPVRSVRLNNGYEMRAWFDLYVKDGKKAADESDILTTVGWITALIDQEISSGTRSDKILLAGFSQGGVIALHTGLRYPKRLAGIMALSTYVPFDENLFNQASETQKGLEIFAAHGQSDSVIPVASWQDYVPKLQDQGHEVEAHIYQMEHSVNLEEIQDISQWLQSTLDLND